jgi:hypothetical protein
LNNSFGNGPQEFAGNVTLSGGTLGLVCNNDLLYGNVTISSNGGTVNLGDYYNPTIGHTVTISGTGGGSLQGAGSLTLIGATIPTNTASLTLTGNANSFSGAITITTHATLVSQAQQGYGNTFGTNTITFNNGYLLIADNGGSGTGVANTPLSGYNNNLVLNGPGTITMGGSTGSSSNTTGNTVPFNNVALYNNTTLTANVYNQYSIGIYGLRIGGTLSGGGTLGGTVPITVTGAVVPGDQPAILNITNTKFSFSGGTNATYSPEINRNLGAGWQGGSTTNAGISYDQINMVAGTGLVMNGAMLNVRMTGGTNSIAAGDEFFLVNQTVAAASGSSFATVVDFTENSITTPETSIGTDPTDNALEYSDPTNPNIEYEVDYVGNIANGALTGGNDVVLDVVSVPEPSVLGLLALGGMGLLARRRRRTTQRN